MQDIAPETAAYLAALCLVPFTVVWMVRRYLPTVWLAFESWGPNGKPLSLAFQSIPSVVIGAAMGAIASGADPVWAALSALGALSAPFLHHALKMLPGPYRGAVRAMLPKDWLKGSLLLLLLPLVVSCTPAVAKYATHTAANAQATALEFADDYVAREYQRAAEVEMSRLQKVGGTFGDFLQWRRESGWAERVLAVTCAFEAHGALVAALEGDKPPPLPARCVVAVLDFAAGSPNAPLELRKALSLARRVLGDGGAS